MQNCIIWYKLKRRICNLLYDDSKEVLNPQMKDDYEQVIHHIKDCMEHNKKSEYLDVTSAIQVIKIRDAVFKS